jgi:hypothetical protein
MDDDGKIDLQMNSNSTLLELHYMKHACYILIEKINTEMIKAAPEQLVNFHVTRNADGVEELTNIVNIVKDELKKGVPNYDV